MRPKIKSKGNAVHKSIFKSKNDLYGRSQVLFITFVLYTLINVIFEMSVSGLGNAGLGKIIRKVKLKIEAVASSYRPRNL